MGPEDRDHREQRLADEMLACRHSVRRAEGAEGTIIERPLLPRSGRSCRWAGGPRRADAEMTTMERGEDDVPPLNFGDHPNGAYWSAFHPDGSKDVDTGGEEEFTVEGTHLRIMWDEGAGPLWGDEGLLPTDPGWMRQALRLSDSLIADLLAWVSDMDAARDRGQSQALLNPRAFELADRLQTEVGSRFKVRFRP